MLISTSIFRADTVSKDVSRQVATLVTQRCPVYSGWLSLQFGVFSVYFLCRQMSNCLELISASSHVPSKHKQPSTPTGFSHPFSLAQCTLVLSQNFVTSKCQSCFAWALVFYTHISLVWNFGYIVPFPKKVL